MNSQIEFEVVDNFWDRLKKGKKLGEGTYGKVFKVSPYRGEVWDEDEKALKILKQKGDCVLEISHLANLNNIDGLLPLNKVYCQGNEIGLLFPLGEDFLDWWNDRKSKHASPLEMLEDILSISKCLLMTISDMHERGIVHRDLSPYNIIFYNSRPCIIDLGFSRQQKEKDQLFTSNYHLTIPSFRPPEILDPDFFEYTSEASLIEKMDLKDESENDEEEQEKDEEGNEENDIISTNLQMIMEDLSDQDLSSSEDEDDEENDKRSETISWKKIFPKSIINKMEWVESADEKQKRVRYYNEKIDEWSLGTILYYLFFDDYFFYGNIYLQWFQFHCYYYNRYGKWLTDKHPDIFSKCVEEHGTDNMSLNKKMNEWFKKSNKLITKEEDKKQLSKLMTAFYLILYNLLDPNPNKRMSSKQVLTEVFDSTCLPKKFFDSKEQPLTIHPLQNKSFPLSKLQVKNVLPLITHLYEFSKKVGLIATCYYHIIYIWLSYCYLKNIDDLETLTKSLAICFDLIASYKNIDPEEVSSFERRVSIWLWSKTNKSSKRRKSLWFSKNERNEFWIQVLSIQKGNVWIPLETYNLHCSEIEWDDEREYKITNSILFSIQNSSKLPCLHEFSQLLQSFETESNESST